MIQTSIKQKLHEYIEQVNENKVQAIYTLVENEIENRSELYDDTTIKTFQEISKDYFSGKISGHSVEESMFRVRENIRKWNS